MSSAPSASASASASGSASGSGSASSKSLKRLSKEYTTLQQQPLPYATVSLVDDQLTTWHANIKGPSGSPYENGVFKLQLHFPDAYPNKPPEINFVTPIYHLNVSMKTGGSICQDIVSKDWSPVLRVFDLLERIQTMLLTPHAESPLEPEIGEMFHKQPAKYKETAKAWTKKHAQ